MFAPGASQKNCWTQRGNPFFHRRDNPFGLVEERGGGAKTSLRRVDLFQSYMVCSRGLGTEGGGGGARHVQLDISRTLAPFPVGEDKRTEVLKKLTKYLRSSPTGL